MHGISAIQFTHRRSILNGSRATWPSNARTWHNNSYKEKNPLADDTSELQLKNWFGYLNSFKICAQNINTDLATLSLLDFANAKPSTYLTDEVRQKSFVVCTIDKTGIAIDVSAVSKAKSFVDLLGATFGVLDRYIAAYLRFLTPAPFNTMLVGNFILQKTSAVFPGGATDPTWITTNTALTKIIDSSCYTPAQQTTVGQLVADPNKQINDVVNRIVKLG
jgi:hypothetical protein